jgi:predicted DNA binding CopG/RHH family protein/uncharacterized DUF497 family protein
MDFQVVGFEWDHANRDKCRKHGVSIADIEVMFAKPLAVFPDPFHSRQEERFKAIGSSQKSRPSFSRYASAGLTHGFGQSAPVTCTERKLSTMKKKLPRLRSYRAAEDFVATADLTRYDLSGMVPVRFEFKPKTERINMRLSKDLLESVKKHADKAGVSYQRFIRLALERAVSEA